MDAYSNHIIELSNARLGDLRREAAEYALSAAARRSRGSWWQRARSRFQLSSESAPEPVMPWGSRRHPEALEHP